MRLCKLVNIMQTQILIGCLSHGIQVVPARVQFCQSFYFDKKQKLQQKTDQLLDNIQNMVVYSPQQAKIQREQPSQHQVQQTFAQKMKTLQYDIFDAQLNLRKEQFDIQKLDSKTYFSLKKVGLKIWEYLNLIPQNEQQFIHDQQIITTNSISIQQTSVLIPKLFRYNVPQQIIKRNQSKKRGNKRFGKQKTKIEEKCQANFKKDWLKKIKFFLKDGAKQSTFDVDESDGLSDQSQKLKSDQQHTKRQYSHLYSYNKVMRDKDLVKICQAINNTNWKVLCWYQNPKKTRKFGLKNFILVHKYSIQSTGAQKYTAFIFARTKPQDRNGSSQGYEDDLEIFQSEQDEK